MEGATKLSPKLSFWHLWSKCDRLESMHYMTSFLQSNAVLKLNSSVMITFQYSLQSPFVKLLFLLLKGKENESWSSFNDGTYELGNKWLFPRSFLLYMTWRTWVPGLLRSEQITVLRSDLYMCALHCEVVVEAFFRVVAIPNHKRFTTQLKLTFAIYDLSLNDRNL